MLDFGGTVSDIQGVLAYGLLALTFGVELFAFVDALRRSAQHYPAAGKRTKNFWLAVTGIALVVSFVVFNPLSLLSIVGFVGACVYLADVRPALQQVGGGGRGSSSGGSYGGW